MDELSSNSDEIMLSFAPSGLKPSKFQNVTAPPAANKRSTLLRISPFALLRVKAPLEMLQSRTDGALNNCPPIEVSKSWRTAVAVSLEPASGLCTDVKGVPV